MLLLLQVGEVNAIEVVVIENSVPGDDCAGNDATSQFVNVAYADQRICVEKIAVQVLLLYVPQCRRRLRYL
jgi:hypothetical protein